MFTILTEFLKISLKLDVHNSILMRVYSQTQHRDQIVWVKDKCEMQNQRNFRIKYIRSY